MAISDITRGGIVLPVRVDPAGLTGPTRKAARGPGWRKVPARGWRVAAAADRDRVDQRIVEAMAGLPDDAALTGWAALWWLGGRWFDGLGPDGRTALPVPVALGDTDSAAPRAGVLLTEDWLFDDDVITIDGLRLTVPERSVSFESRRARWLPQAVVPIDMAAADDLIDLASFAAYVDRLVARKGVPLVRKALGFASENSWSPAEVLMNHLRVTEGRDRPLLRNCPLFDRAGRHIATPDLLDPAACVAGEYDGWVHAQVGTRRRDLDKDAAYREHGIELVTMMSHDRHDRFNFLRRLEEAYVRAARPPQGPRSWTLEQPSWWVDTSTVAARRALTADQRARWLDWRRGPVARRTR